MRYTDRKPVKKSFNRWLVIGPASLLLITGVLFGLEKTNVINLYHSSTPEQTPTTEQRPVNQVDYSPASTTDNEDINKQKESGQTTTAPAPTNDLNVVLTAKDQSGPSKPLEVRTVITPLTTSGICTLTLSKSGASSITKTVALVDQGSYSTCENLDISADQFSTSGTWNLSLVVTGPNSARGETTASVEISI